MRKAKMKETPNIENMPESKKQTIVRELDKIMDKHGGKLDDKIVVDEASDPKHPLHRYFEWDDAKAGYEYRRDQARKLIALKVTVRVVYEASSKPPVPVRVPVRDLINTTRGQGWEPRSEVLNDREKRERFVTSAYAELRRWCMRYADVKELAKIRSAIESMLPALPSEKKNTGTK